MEHPEHIEHLLHLKHVRRRHLLHVFQLGLLLAGSAMNVIYKFQNEMAYKDDNGVEMEWKHPFYTSMLNSIGQSFCCFIYLI